MNISLTPDEARVFLGFIDATLKSKGIEALDAAAAFKAKIQQAAQLEQNESKISPMQSRAGSDIASQLG